MHEIVRHRQRRGFGVLARAVATLGLLLVFTAPGAAAPAVNKTADDVAINGYDAVAYFVDGKAVEGTPDHQVFWQDARWYFANDEHRKLFETDPSRYAPQFGGWCAGGMAQGGYYTVDPEAWAIVDDRLYLYHNREVAEKWRRDQDKNIADAEANWAERGKSP